MLHLSCPGFLSCGVINPEDARCKRMAASDTELAAFLLSRYCVCALGWGEITRRV